MIQKLFRIEELLPGLLRQPMWNTLDVNYYSPRVERVWAQVNDLRVNLHRIHPCDNPLFHPHPWPSAMRIITGFYETAIGFNTGVYDDEEDPPPEAATFLIGAGSVYEMIRPDSWHYVMPIKEPSMSLMVTGQPWDKMVIGPEKNLNPLPDLAKAEILSAFQYYYQVSE